MEFASELLIRASLEGLRLHQTPVRLRPDGRSRRPHLRPFRDGFRHLALMMLMAPTKMSALSLLVPAVIMSSLMLAILIFPSPLDVGVASFGLATLTVSLFLAVGGVVSYVGFRIIRDKLVFSHPSGGRNWESITVRLGLAFSVGGAALMVWRLTIWIYEGFNLESDYGIMKVIILSAGLILLGILFWVLSLMAVALEVFRREGQ